MARGTTRHDSNQSFLGDVAIAGNLTVTGDLALDDITVDDIVADDITADDLTVDAITAGSIALTTKLTVGNANQSVIRESLVLNLAGGALLADGATYVCSIPMRRAGTVKAISVSAHTVMVGGTNTLALAKKQGGTSVSLISTATVDPVSVPSAADTAQALTLTGTGANLIFAAGDCLKATLVCGTMTTDGQGYAVCIDVEYTDV